MSRFLSLECDPIDQPAATDALERATWSAVRIRIGDRVVSRVWDRSKEQERTHLDLPVYPIARWLVSNWWSLLHESPRSESLPQFFSSSRTFDWMRRHCFRAAEAGLTLPLLYLYHDGRSLRAEWRADAVKAVDQPIEFVSEGEAALDDQLTREALSDFVEHVLSRLKLSDDLRAQELQSDWKAIRSATQEETDFCQIAGRLGIDPYDDRQMTPELARFIESSLSDPNDPLTRDLTEVAAPGTIETQWKWISTTTQDLNLARPTARPMPIRTNTPSFAHEAGYLLAQQVRKETALDGRPLVASVEQLASDYLGSEFVPVVRNHIPGREIRVLLGRCGRQVIVAGPRVPREDSRRFLLARAFFLAMFDQHGGNRLVTSSFSWDQKASRAFAAELLAPRAMLAERVESGLADEETVDSLSEDYRVSTRVVKNQLQNCGIALAEE